MPRARFYKTLFLPPLEGQYLMWKNEFSQFANKVDEIVQLGNIIGITDRVKDSADRGPNQAALNYIALYRSTFPNWTQLIGPNEIMALNFPDEWTNAESLRLLRRRWLLDDPNLFVTAAVNKKRLVTHGGLTYGEWVEIGRPETPEEAAGLLNEKYARTLFQGDCMKTTGRPSFSANPIFADPIREVYGSWITAPVAPPFHQLHSSGGLNTAEGRNALSPFSLLEHVDGVRYTNFGSVVDIRGALFTSVYVDFPKNSLIKKLPRPGQPLLEKIPVIDLRDEIFDDSSDEKNNLRVEETIR